jgi:hypothetical protein
LSLDDAPLTALFSPNDADRSVEDRYFADWENTLGSLPRFPLQWRTVLDSGRVALEHIQKGDAGISTGDMHMSDYRVEAWIRHMLPTSKPGPDDEYRLVGRTGIVFRMQDQRRYYYFCIESYDRIILYRREDENFVALDWYRFPMAPDRYHHAVVQTSGTEIVCWMDGVRRFRVFDESYPSGRCGVRTTTLARFRDLVVTTDPGGDEAGRLRRCAYRDETRRAAAGYPKPRLLHTVPFPDSGGWVVHFADLVQSGRRDCVILLPQGTDTSRSTRASTISGQALWEQDLPGCTLARSSDMDADGCAELIGLFADGTIKIVSGKEGAVVDERPLPEASPYTQERGSILRPILGPWLADIRGIGARRDIVLVEDRSGEGGYRLWVFDDRLHELWHVTVDQPAYGHHLDFLDVDGDGCDEILAGYHLVDHDGTVLWQMVGSEYLDWYQAARHPDIVLMGEFGGHDHPGNRGFLCCGGEGLFLVDMNDGQILAHHRVGHVQDATVGKYRVEMSGLQLWCCTRWGNAGIHVLVSGNGNILQRMEPDVVSEVAGQPTNWRGDGEELYLLSSSAASLGLWDSYGRRVVSFEHVGEAAALAGAHSLAMDVAGDCRDELLFVSKDAIRIFSNPEPPAGPRIYAPERRWDMTLGTQPRLPFPAATPLVSRPAWR